MRKKQERLAKARLMLLHEESEEPAEALVPMEVEDDKEIDLEDPAEMVVEQVVTGDDTLDEYLRSIESEVVPQDGTLFAPQQVTAIGLEEIGPAEQPEEDEDYYASFLAAFKPQPGPVAEDKSKPEVCYEEDDDIIWDRLQLDEDDEASSRVVRPRQQHKAQEKREIPLPPAGFTYEPIRKNLYVQSPELARLTYEETISLREEMAGIKVRGKRCPAPILNWYQCGLSDKILKALERKGFKGPFPIQSQVSAS
jgi:ATP-dependent RNA helicase DDX46/PRP5